MLFRLRRRTVIPVACWYGDTSEVFAPILNEQARRHRELRGFTFEPAAIKDNPLNSLEKPWIKTPDEFLELARKCPVVIAAHLGVEKPIADILRTIPESQRPIQINFFRTTAVSEDAEKTIASVLEHLRNKKR